LEYRLIIKNKPKEKKIKRMKLTTLENVAMSEITKALNEGFSDYILKFNATEEYLTTRWRGGRVNLSLSVGGWVDGKLEGLLVSGIDDWEGVLTAFNIATCVAPLARGNHFTSKAYDFLIPKLEEIGVKQLMLEVIQGNDQAIPVYERIGFKNARGLLCFSGEPRIRQLINMEGVEIIISNKLDLEKAILFHDFDPSWESTFLGLIMNWDQYDVYQILKNNELIGYGIVNANTGSIMSFAIHPDHRRKTLGTLLFSKIHEKHSVLKINNIDENDHGSIEFLRSLLLSNPINQYEMMLLL
jgi:GNAT superfamily N-acetyltransferase